MDDLKFALVGCGRISRKHVDAISRAQNARLVAVCDLDLSRAKAIGDKLGIPSFADMDDMIAKVPAIDVVNVLTPTGYHAQHAVRLAAYGKHIVVEKPMALKLEDADEMIVACDRAGVRLFVVKQNRYNLPVQRLRKALEAGRFGKLVMGTVRVRWCRRQDYYDQDAWRGTWELDGGVLANQASHHVDLLMWMLGPVESVVGMTATQLVNVETEDTAAVLLRFANGALGIVEATTATRPVDLEGSLSILGERGTVVIGGFAVNELSTWRFEEPTADDASVIEESRTQPDNVYGFGHQAFIENVVKTIRGQGAALVDGLEGRKSIEVINAIYESVQTGREVALRYRPKLSPLGKPRGNV
ncbi:MAG TPA: Gfo/Idh/MocA family oxidoreductase [Kofleriaceae bacterium]|jgi:predicted dehydrogenase